MAEFEEAFRKMIASEGTASSANVADESNVIVLCSDCFFDEGLKLDASRIGIDMPGPCVNCNSDKGRKLTRELVYDLSYRFFVRGTIHKTEYGGSPRIQFNSHHFGQSSIEIPSWLTADVRLLEQTNKVGFFYYGPRLWMLGENEALKGLKNGKTQETIISNILNSFPARKLTFDHPFYRVRVNPSEPGNFFQYDAPPDQRLGKARFDACDFPVLYASPDLELCVHECRSTIEDDLFVATLVPVTSLNMLDLSALLEEEEDEFTSLDIAMHFLFMAGKHSYPICRAISRAAHCKGFDGIIFPSYFSNAKTGAVPFETAYGISIRKIDMYKNYAQSTSIPNIALFGRPILDGKVKLKCINKIVINQVSYNLTFGPCV